MNTSPRYLRARVVDFAGESDGGSLVAGRRMPSVRGRGDRKIAARLKRAKALRRRIRRLQGRGSRGAERRVTVLTAKLRVLMNELRALGWTPRRGIRTRLPGAKVDPTDDLLESLPDDTPEDLAEPEPPIDDEGGDEMPETEGEGNWLDQHVGVGAIPKPREWLTRAKRALTPKRAWNTAVPLGDVARIETRSGQRAMVATVAPGLYIVQVVSDDAARKVAGDNIGVLPLLLYPLVKQKVQQALAPKSAAPTAAPAVSNPPKPAQGELACDRC
jgi:hypothetical protein